MTRALSVLLTEDDLADAFLISELLREVGMPMEIAVVSDGQAALDILGEGLGCSAARPPGIMFLKPNIPKVNGF